MNNIPRENVIIVAGDFNCRQLLIIQLIGIMMNIILIQQKLLGK